jgi:large subunit ribosomal protein L21
MKYAIVQTSGKQFFLRADRWYDIDLIKKEKIGELITLNKILLFKKNLQVQLGKPFLTQATISARIVQEVKGVKILVLKTKPKKHYTRSKGHRQKYSRIELIN